ncbi:hypothetical protein YC2023_123412 [Brassica napus]
MNQHRGEMEMEMEISRSSPATSSSPVDQAASDAKRSVSKLADAKRSVKLATGVEVATFAITTPFSKPLTNQLGKELEKQSME